MTWQANRRTLLKLAGAAGIASLLPLPLPALAAAAAAGTFSPLRPPATPLAVRSMYLSAWQPADNLAGTWSTFWNGQVAALAGIVRVDGTAYVFAGAPGVNGGQLPAINQTALVVTATSSHYTFQGSGVQLDVTFFSPVDPDDPQRQSVPFSYVTAQATSLDGNAHHVSVYVDISGEWSHGDSTQLIGWSQATVGNQIALSHSPANPTVLGEYNDHASWGTVVIAADAISGLTWQIGQDTVVRANAANNGTLPNTVDGNQPRAINNAWPVFGFNLDLGSSTGVSQQFVVCLGHVRTPAVSYLGAQLDPWWRTYWSGWQDMLTWFRNDLPSAQAVAAQLESRLALDVRTALGTGTTADQYHALCGLALRQAFGGTELVNRGGAPWAFLKEISSDGNVSTVDVVYPASPAYLYLSPNYLRLLLQPLFHLAESGGWSQAFAEHDVGAHYPVADGHLSGQEDMPVEETANMLIMTAALLRHLPATDATAFANAHYAILHSWAEYLVANALDPGNQNQTDDFTGFIAHSVNLALKGIIAIGAMGIVAAYAGNSSDASHYASTAQSYITQWQSMGEDSSGQHLKLAYDQAGTWSLKYNGYPDKLLGTNLVQDSVAAQESAWYTGHAGSYGVVLDPRNPFTKVDWELWTAAWLNNHPAAATLISGAYGFVGATPNRVPITDLYTVSDATQTQPENFKARPVLGGLFALLTLHNTPNALAGHWPLDSSGVDYAGNLNTLTFSGGVTLTTGRVGGGVTMDGTGVLTAPGQVLRTDRSFTVSAWVSLTSAANFATAVSQDGLNASGFFLQYSAADGRWAFARLASDSVAAPATRALSTATPTLATWTHLTGVYDATAGQLRLYVNGALGGTANYSTGWHAAGPLRIGRALWNGAAADGFPGSIDEVRAYNRALSDAEAAAVYHIDDGLVARYPLDDSGTTASDVIGGHNATSSGAVSWGTGYSGGGVVLGGGGYLSTSGPLIGTDQAFTVSAWAYLTSTAGFATILSQDGSQASGFYLQYSQRDNRWAFAQVASDAANATPTRALSRFAPQLDAWTHLVGVSDTTQLRLYVNGTLSGTAAHSGAWNATGAFQIGRGKWNGGNADLFQGTIDDVRVYSRALTDTDVATLI